MDFARSFSWWNKSARKPKTSSNTRKKNRRGRELISPLEPRILMAFDYWVATTHVDQAWNIAGSSKNVVAVLDSGVDLSNPQLAPHIYQKPANLVGLDGVPGDVNGADFVPIMTGGTPDGNVQDDNGHGTFVSGLIAGVRGLGISGVNQAATILPIKVADADGFSSDDAMIAGINYAIELKTLRGVNIGVMNISIGGYFSGPRSGIGSTSDFQLFQAIDRAGQAGIIVVMAAGNFTQDHDVVNESPGGSPNSFAITAAATDNMDQPAYFSDFGKRTVDVAAPGVSITSNLLGGGVVTEDGTSFSSPITAGILSLMKSTFPKASPGTLVQALLRSVDVLPQLADFVSTSGRDNAYRAIESMLGSRPGSGVVDKLTNYNIQGWAYDPNVGIAPVNVTIKVDGVTVGTTQANVNRPDLAFLGSTLHGFSYNLTGLTPGNHTVSVYRDEISTDAFGNLTTTQVLMKSAVVSGTVLPFGFLDKVSPTLVQGWAFDPNLGALPDLVRIDIDGVPVTTSTANASRPDLAFLGSTLHGFNFNISVTPGTHRVDAYAIDDAAPNTPVFIGSKTIVSNTPVNAWVDSTSQKQIVGWAVDPDNVTATVRLQLIIDGKAYAMLDDAATVDRPDLTFLAPGNQTHGFVIDLPPMATGTHNVQLFAIDANTGTHMLLTSFAVQGNQPPTGWLDFSDQAAGVQSIKGWVEDPDETTPIQYRIDIDGNTGLLATANLARPDLTFLPPTNQNHGFDVLTPLLNPGIHTLKLYAFDPWSGEKTLILTHLFNIYDNPANARPTGAATVDPSGGFVSGTAVDPNDPTAFLTVDVLIDGVSAGSTTANINGHGFNFPFGSMTPGVRHTIQVSAEDSTASGPTQDTVLLMTTLDAPTSGFIDIASPDHVVGWGQVIGSSAIPTLRLDVNGQAGLPFAATVVRTDGLAGFDLKDLTFVPGSTNTLTLNYLDPVTGDTIVLDRKTMVVANPPVLGHLDLVSTSQILGWAYAPYDLAALVNIQVRVDGAPVAMSPAGQTRSDLASLNQQGHAFVIGTPFMSKGKHTIALWMEDPASGRLISLGSSQIVVL